MPPIRQRKCENIKTDKAILEVIIDPYYYLLESIGESTTFWTSAVLRFHFIPTWGGGKTV